jgi:hypothetical protein
MSVATRVAGLLVLSAGAAVSAVSAQPPADKKDDTPAPTKWSILFRSDDPSAWNKDAKNSKGEQVAIPAKYAPEDSHYLRLRRMDTGDYQIIRIIADLLLNGKPHDPESTVWWNGSAKNEYGGRHLGIVELPRYKFAALPKGLIGIMTTEGWDAFTGSGFGHKVAVNDAQYYCWRGKEIPRTVFEIAVSEGPLSPEEKRSILSSRP